MNKNFITLLIGASTIFACDDDTSIIGIDVMPNADNISTHTEIFPLNTSTIKVDAVLANTKTCYLGSIVDPELHVKTTSDFLAQFHLPEKFQLPKYEDMMKDEEGCIIADSCDIQLFFEHFYGDSLTTMKLDVQELSKENVLEESVNYYTDLNPIKYVNTDSEYHKSLTYSIKDLSRPNKTSIEKRIHIKLPTKYASYILNEYYSHPEYFKDSYKFIHHVCPGFYFKNSGGVGSMIATKNLALNVYFKHSVKLNEEKDTIIDGMQRFGATEEVIQCSSIDNEYPGNLVEDLMNSKNSTYVKTPAAFFTEMEIPISKIISGEHKNDSINLAEVTIRRFNNLSSSEESFNPPSYLLMVTKDNLNKFFEDRDLPDSKKSYLSTKFNAAKNSYSFTNIGQLITHLKIERNTGANILASDSEAVRQEKIQQWETKHPDWNKVVLVPVQAIFVKATDYYGNPIEKLQSVQHELGLTSAKLEGGSESPLNIKIIYSRYNR